MYLEPTGRYSFCFPSPFPHLLSFLLWDSWSGSPTFFCSWVTGVYGGSGYTQNIQSSAWLSSSHTVWDHLIHTAAFAQHRSMYGRPPALSFVSLGETGALRILPSTMLATQSAGLWRNSNQQPLGLNWKHLQKLTWDSLALGESLWALPDIRKEISLPSILFFEGDSLHNLHKISHCPGEDDWLIKNT